MNARTQTSLYELIDEMAEARISRRNLLRAGPGLSVAGFLGGCESPRPATGRESGPLIGFTPIPVSKADTVVVVPEYAWQVVNASGDPIMPGAPDFKADGSDSAAEQAMQSGVFHDGMHFFPLPRGSESSEHGLIAINYEYADDNLLSPDGVLTWNAEKVQKSKNAHGPGVFEVTYSAGRWQTVRDSRYGRRALGTFNNCANGYTTWGTHLSCEENFIPYFVNNSGSIPRLQDRCGVPAE
jgi:hypothetical protein